MGSASKEIVRSGFAEYDHVIALTITSGLIATGAILADKIAANVISSSHLRTDTAVITASAQIQNLIVKTAHIDELQVGTTKITNNAITNSGTWRGSPEITHDNSTWFDIATLAITVLGGFSVVVWAKTEVGVSGGGVGEYQLIHSESSTQLDFNTHASSDTYWRGSALLGIYTPASAGAATFKLQMRNIGAGLVAARNRSMVIIELKK